MSGFSDADRWMVHISAPPVTSKHVAVGRYEENTLKPKRENPDFDVRVPAEGTDLASVIQTDRTTGAIRIMNASLPGIPLTDMPGAIDRDEIGDDAEYPEVNRDAKGDFMITRETNDFIRGVETKPGTFRRFGALMLKDEVEVASASTFVSPEGQPQMAGGTMLASLPNAYSDFLPEGTTLETAGKTMLAMLPPVRDRNDAAGLVPVVYTALLPAPNLSAEYEEAEEALTLLQRRPNPGEDLGSWKDDDDYSGSVKYSRRELHCLATAVYFEARGESEKGQLAVGQVIINRVQSKHWPNSICGVVYQNKKWHNRCQFSFACDGKADRIRDRDSWQRAKAVADKFANGYTMRSVARATHYHATYVRPRWARHFRKVERVGTHVFYRSRTGGWS